MVDVPVVCRAGSLAQIVEVTVEIPRNSSFGQFLDKVVDMPVGVSTFA